MSGSTRSHQLAWLKATGLPLRGRRRKSPRNRSPPHDGTFNRHNSASKDAFGKSVARSSLASVRDAPERGHIVFCESAAPAKVALRKMSHRIAARAWPMLLIRRHEH